LIVLVAAVLAGGIVVLGMPTSTASTSTTTDAGSAAPDAAGHRAPLVVPVVEPAPAPVGDLDDAGETGAATDPERAPDHESEPGAMEPSGEGSKRRPKPAVDRDRRRYGEGTRARAAPLAHRGRLLGDDAERDRLRQRAAQEAQQRDYGAALHSLDDASARAGAVVIDRGFVERKLARFNGAFDKVADDKRRAAADARVAKVMSTLAEKRYQEANDVLNGAFELLR
jgi:hypothetical protein